MLLCRAGYGEMRARSLHDHTASEPQSAYEPYPFRSAAFTLIHHTLARRLVPRPDWPPSLRLLASPAAGRRGPTRFPRWPASRRAGAEPAGAQAETFRHYIDAFNQNDRELYVQHIPNAAAWEFLKSNIPLLECPDRRSRKSTTSAGGPSASTSSRRPTGSSSPSFCRPSPGRANTTPSIAPPAITFARAAGSRPPVSRRLRALLVSQGRRPAPLQLLGRRRDLGPLPGHRRRPACGGAAARPGRQLRGVGEGRIATPTACSGRTTTGTAWRSPSAGAAAIGRPSTATCTAMRWPSPGSPSGPARHSSPTGSAPRPPRSKRLVQEKLGTRRRSSSRSCRAARTRRWSDAREEHGYTPWYFNLPDPDKSVAWKQVMDPHGFYAPFGPTTAERRHPKFTVAYTGHECQWNGPSWPYATAVTLTAMANLLDDYQQDVVRRKDYFDLLKAYTRSHHLKRDDGRVVPWIDENLNPTTGDWIARTAPSKQRGSQGRRARQGLQPLHLLRPGHQRAGRPAPARRRHGRGQSAGARGAGTTSAWTGSAITAAG